MKKNFREMARIAEREGVENCQFVNGSPHGRIIGTYRGKAFCMVAPGSTGKVFGYARGLCALKTNIRRKLREMDRE